MVSALSQFKKEYSKDPEQAPAVGQRRSCVSRETTVPLDELMTLAFTGTTINPKKVVNVVLPGGTGMVGNLSVVNLDQTMLDAISATSPTTAS